MTSQPATAPRGPAGLPESEADGLARVWLAPFSVDIPLTLSVHRRGPRDPAYRVDQAGAVWRAVLTPDGPGTLRLAAGRAAGAVAGPVLPLEGQRGSHASCGHGGPEPRGSDPAIVGGPRMQVHARAWGPGAAWLLAAVPDMLGDRDNPAGFRPEHARLRHLAARLPGLRVGRTGRVLEALVPAVLEQKVVSIEAHRAWRLLLTWHGHQAPGPAPAGMRVPPAAAGWQAIPAWDWHRAGVEAVRARTIMTAARLASRLEPLAGLPGERADRLLQTLPGIGPWTAAEVRQRACGDADAVSIGDYHIPSLVGWALTGAAVDDAGMLGLLAPYPGHRYRVTRLIELGGQGPPRRGPRMSVRDYRAI